jgi:hypothetical protein
VTDRHLMAHGRQTMRTVQPDTENRSNTNRSALIRPRLLETLRAPVMCKHAAENITADSLAHRDACAALNYFESISDVILAAMFLDVRSHSPHRSRFGDVYGVPGVHQ